MFAAADQVLTVAQMVSAEQRLMDAGSDVHELMQRAGHGAADYVWRMASGAPRDHGVTVLCGPGNNGGDGYVIAESLRGRGGNVAVVSALPPTTDAAKRAAALYGGAIIPAEAAKGAILVDCLFGSGLNRALSSELEVMVNTLVRRHVHAIAIDLPSGVESDSGALLTERLPHYRLCISLGAWKRAHFLMPAMACWDDVRLVDIGAMREPECATSIQPPCLAPPETDAHKYRRGLVVVVGGAMPGAGVLAARGAAHGGAGYVKLLSRYEGTGPDWLVADAVGDGDLAEALDDRRIAALLCGPGLGRDDNAAERLRRSLDAAHPTVLDADALIALDEPMRSNAILTPHEGELAALERSFELSGDGSKADRTIAVADATNAVVIAKGPDTVIAAPDGRLAFAPAASTWLSVAGTGDVLAGISAARLAVTGDPWAAACEAVWLHAEAARIAGPAFHAADLANCVRNAVAGAL